jgi:SAM-dependent methyltransferase
LNNAKDRIEQGRTTPRCIVCDSRSWRKLPDPSPHRSITTSGLVVEEPLGKSQCAVCGAVQRTEFRYLGLTYFYETRYDAYYDRPGTQVFNSQRYVDIVRWISSSIGNLAPESILEVGCGRGWTLGEIKKVYPYARIHGIEPSVGNSEEARKRGFVVHTGKLEGSNLLSAEYDLVFSNHVIQHSTDAHSFLEAMGAVVSPHGLVVIIAQDSTHTSNELLYSDQNYSFMPEHLVKLANRAGLRVLSWKKPLTMDSLSLSQLVVCCRMNASHELHESDDMPVLTQQFLDRLYTKRIQYLEAWPKINEYLLRRTSRYRDVYNFGAGMYSYLLLCYCNDYWNRVRKCTVDGFSGQFSDKQVVPFDKLAPSEEDCIVMGTRPSLQGELTGRIIGAGWNAIRWDNFVDA